MFCADVADRIVNEITKDSKVSTEVINNHLMSLYHKTKELVTRSTKTILTEQKFYPISESMHTFAIKLEVELTIASFEYFCKEYKRQVILQVYDMEWKTFVLYMMGNLDRAEIEMLDNKYSKMTKDIHRIILRRLQYASIPFDIRNESNTNEEEDEKTDRVSSQRCIDLSILQQVNFVHVEAERNTSNATEVTFAVIINQKTPLELLAKLNQLFVNV